MAPRRSSNALCRTRWLYTPRTLPSDALRTASMQHPARVLTLAAAPHSAGGCMAAAPPTRATASLGASAHKGAKLPTCEQSWYVEVEERLVVCDPQPVPRRLAVCLHVLHVLHHGMGPHEDHSLCAAHAMTPHRDQRGAQLAGVLLNNSASPGGWVGGGSDNPPWTPPPHPPPLSNWAVG